MPITVQLSGSLGETQDFRLENTTNNEEFIVNVPFQVTNVEFDPNKDIISRNNTATLSNEQFELENSLVLYPNPSDNELHIKLPNSIELKEVEFYNAIGQLTLTKNTADFSVSQLNNGVHFVKITTNQGVIHKNFIKK
jgi:hypothetical protein